MFGCFRRINVFGGRFFGEPPAAVFCEVHNVSGTFFCVMLGKSCIFALHNLRYKIYVMQHKQL